MDYRSIVEAGYERAGWLSLLGDIFGSCAKLFKTPERVQADSHLADEAYCLGQISLPDGYVIAVYEVRLSDEVRVERNRAGIRNLLLGHWRNGFAGAIMLCYRCNEAVLRFSYVSEVWQTGEGDKYTKRSTDTRRYTYLLGAGHRSRTAIEQLEQLKASGKRLQDLTRAFSVEALSDRFFLEYKRCYEDIVEYATGKRMVKVANRWEERSTGPGNEGLMSGFSHFASPEKALRDYVKKLMGRLVFIQFLQKKGWMGASSGAAWEDGDRDYVQHLFARSAYKDTFVDDVLRPLFEALNTQRPGDLVGDPRVGCGVKVPYLNGGLFEQDEMEGVRFPLPARYIEQILRFFAEYNFTIDENDPDDAEVGVDPEMLGRVFENLLEDNKDKGAFYTPKEIVQYMCRESLVAYLQTGVTDEPTLAALRRFVETHDAGHLCGAESALSRQVDERLRNVKICDPAIGSGAFPMGLLRELFSCRQALEGISPERAVQIKRHIIEQNIYGVDIERGAVDIARLRFWLALIVDEATPAALPNLDFKIMQGNSLLEQYRGVDLSTVTERKGDKNVTIFDKMVDVKRKWLRDCLGEYYSCTEHGEKVGMRRQIQEAVREVLREDSIGADFEGLDLSATSEFFLWHTWFSDVFDRAEPGFDVVIGNPPYVQLQNNGGEQAAYYANCGYQTFARTGDIYCLFYERGMQLLRQGGHLCYITSNKWMRAGYGENTRLFFSKYNPQLLIDFAGVKVFESATVDTNILLLQNAENAGQTRCAVANKKDGISNMSLYMRQSATTSSFAGTESWVILSPIEQSIRRKIEALGKPLAEWGIQINYGIKTGSNEAFVISRSKREEILTACADEDERQRTAELIRPFLRGRDLRKQAYEWAGLYLIATLPSRHYDINQYPAVRDHLLAFGRERLEQAGRTYIVNGEEIKSRKKTGNKWFEVQDSINYWEDFSKPKLFYADITQRLNFCLCEETMYCNNTVYFISSTDKGLLCKLCYYLNTKLINWYYRTLSVQLGEKAVRMFNIYVNAIPIPFDLDADVYETFHLTPDEIAYIESREG